MVDLVEVEIDIFVRALISIIVWFFVEVFGSLEREDE